MAKLLFEDNFEGNNLDMSKWNIKSEWKPSNSPVCMLTENVSVSNGNLIIKSRNDGGGPCDLQRSSGYIDTKNKLSFKFGYAEMRAKLPKGKGIWPAFWLLPSPSGWPPEIDIFEMLGHQPNKLYFTVHTQGNDPNCGGYSNCKSGSYSGPDYSEDYHTYAIEWVSNYIAWFVDGVERFRSTQYVTQIPMFLVIDTYVGGDWPGNPDNTTQWPQYFNIDYVRVYDSKPSSTKKYKCTGAPDYKCVEDPNGEYDSLEKCQTACKETPEPANLLRGVNWSGLEWGSMEGLTKNFLARIKTEWNINIFRFCFNRYDYLNNSSYRQNVRDATNWCKELEIVMVLDHQWESQSSKTVPLPNKQQTIDLWDNISKDMTYKNSPYVWFDIWNEPHDCSIEEWKDIADACVTKIRNNGANNTCLVAGIDWASTIKPWRGKYLTQPNIVYSCHVYYGGGPASDLDNNIGLVLKDGKDVFVGETAPYWEEPFNDGQVQWFENTLLPWLDGNNRGSGMPTTKIGFTAWAMTTDPYLAESDHITPTDPYGKIVQNKLKETPQPTKKYKCTGAPDYKCVEDPNGEYDSLEKCQTACKPPTKKYKCTGAPDYKCVEDPNGEYDSLEKCQTACKPPTKKFDVHIISTQDKPTGVLVLKQTKGDYTEEEACKLVCKTIKDMDQ